ncbi:hypothetical protein [Actinocatenispora rupis]|uniref:hypothetical protein n=1 Tax=Actinocatenispora rupis TaxID=519421 RepID=UPI00194326ED|nr:hypothetical protein [Actinocatenispora rupis]
MSVAREQRVAATFVELADTLVYDFDVVDLLHTLACRSVELSTCRRRGSCWPIPTGRYRWPRVRPSRCDCWGCSSWKSGMAAVWTATGPAGPWYDRALVRSFCAEHHLSYTEPGPVRSYAIVLKHLNTVGTSM